MDIREYNLAGYAGNALYLIRQLRQAGATDAWAEMLITTPLHARIETNSAALCIMRCAQFLRVFYQATNHLALCASCDEMSAIVPGSKYCASCDATNEDGATFGRNVPHPMFVEANNTSQHPHFLR